MKVNYHFRPSIRDSHIAVLGKTGSGKTSTAKLLVEQIADSGGRVCILDPIKSDWWGLTSSANGKNPGFPFYILGGPHGHVPLHGAAGKALGEVVANGSLPLSIIDMADFGPGDHAKFFIDFAQSLFRNAKGVLHLVVEEAHIFAPKDQRGDGNISHSIHWMSRIASGARSKGIRLVVCTQRTQKLHNDVLGSCESAIIHRLTLPADQTPALNWLATNADPATVKTAGSTLASLRPGEAWICSGEANVFERTQFPMIATYDNSATPTDDVHREVKTAAVDKDKLNSIIGVAVQEAEANDPKKLRAEIAELKKQLATAPKQHVQRVEVPMLTKNELGEIEDAMRSLADFQESSNRVVHAIGLIGKVKTQPVAQVHAPSPKVVHPPRPKVESNGAPSAIGNSGKRRILIALAQNPTGLSKRKLSILTGISSTGGTWRTYLSELRGDGYAEGSDPISITDAGIEALGSYEPLPTGAALIDFWRNRLGDSGKRRIFDLLVEAYPHSLDKATVSESTGIDMGGGTWRTYMSELRGLEIVEGSAQLKAAAVLFE